MLINIPCDDEMEWLVLGVAYFALSLLFVAGIISGSRQYKQGGFAFVKTMCSQRAWTICDCIPRSSIRKELQQKVEALAERRQRDFSRRVIFVGCSGATFVLIVFMGVKHIDMGFDRDNASLNLVQGHMMLLSLSVVLFAVCLVFAEQPRHFFRVLMHIASMTRMTATVFMYRTSEQLLFDRYNIAVARMCVSLVIGGGLNLTIGLNALLACFQVAAWVTFGFDGEQLDEKYGPYSTRWFAIHEFSLTLVLCAITAASEKRTVTEAETSVQAKADRTVEQAIRRLLVTTYDVVMQLSEGFVIQHDAFELSAFLMHGTDRSARGRNFLDYMHSSEDRGGFEKWMQDTAVQQSPMGVPIYVQLRDSFGAAVPVEIVHSTFLDMEDKTQHLIGMREKDKAEMQQPPPLDASGEEHCDIRASSSSNLSRQSIRRSQRGTPARAEASRMDADADSDSASALNFHSLSQGSELMRPGFQPSSLHAKIGSIMTLLFSWNLPARKVRCCEYHDRAKEASGLLRKLIKRECYSHQNIEGLRNTFDHQCSDCGLMIPHTSSCYFCAPMDARSRHPPTTIDAHTRFSL